MFDLILGVAQSDERIRAVFMNGSRADPKAQKDRFQDYDIVYVVADTASFITDRDWISVFGERIMLQEPDSNNLGRGLNADPSRSYGWLMLFTDGNRIDLHIKTTHTALEDFKADSQTILLLDKDHLLPHIPPPSDRTYRIQKPTQTRYNGCCNQFWWCLNNVAKGLVRDQLPYTMCMYHETVHVELDAMLSWYIGIKTDFSVSTGLWGKYFKRYLPNVLYTQYTMTYASFDSLWNAVFTACSLFRQAAKFVGTALGYTYSQRDDDQMTSYLQKIRDGEL